jgi:hypothetical protein
LEHEPREYPVLSNYHNNPLRVWFSTGYVLLAVMHAVKASQTALLRPFNIFEPHEIEFSTAQNNNSEEAQHESEAPQPTPL